MIKNKKIQLLLSILICLIVIKLSDLACDFQHKIYHNSESIYQSKKNNVFIRNVILKDSKFTDESESLKVINFSGWLEKGCTYEGEKLIEVKNDYYKIICNLELDKRNYLNVNNYSDTWYFFYKDSYSAGTSRGSISDKMLQIDFDLEKDSISKPIFLKVKKNDNNNSLNFNTIIGILELQVE